MKRILRPLMPPWSLIILKYASSVRSPAANNDLGVGDAGNDRRRGGCRARRRRRTGRGARRSAGRQEERNEQGDDERRPWHRSLLHPRKLPCQDVLPFSSEP